MVFRVDIRSLRRYPSLFYNLVAFSAVARSEIASTSLGSIVNLVRHSIDRLTKRELIRNWSLRVS